MTRESALQEILKATPRVVYVSGKTCTGKTTFANEVRVHGYKEIELDRVVTNSVVIPFALNAKEAFITAYGDDGPKEHVEAFIIATKKEIREKLAHSSLVIEGAIAKSRILKEIFSGELANFFFVYFHPIHLEKYMERIRSRFVAGAHNNTDGLPKRFWDMVKDEDVKDFLKSGIVNAGIEESIREYAKISMKESEERLSHLKESFADIHVVEV